MKEMPAGAREFIEDAALTTCLQVVFEDDEEREEKAKIVSMEPRAQ